MRIPLYVICCFPLAVSNISFLCLIFVSLINMCLDMFFLESILFETPWASCPWVVISFPILGNISTIISSIFSCPFLLSFSSGTPMIQMLGHFTLSQRSLRLSSVLFILCFSFLLYFTHFHHSIFPLTYPFFCLSYSKVSSLQSLFILFYFILI